MVAATQEAPLKKAARTVPRTVQSLVKPKRRPTKSFGSSVRNSSAGIAPKVAVRFVVGGVLTAVILTIACTAAFQHLSFVSYRNSLESPNQAFADITNPVVPNDTSRISPPSRQKEIKPVINQLEIITQASDTRSLKLQKRVGSNKRCNVLVAAIVGLFMIGCLMISIWALVAASAPPPDPLLEISQPPEEFTFVNDKGSTVEVVAGPEELEYSYTVYSPNGTPVGWGQGDSMKDTYYEYGYEVTTTTEGSNNYTQVITKTDSTGKPEWETTSRWTEDDSRNPTLTNQEIKDPDGKTVYTFTVTSSGQIRIDSNLPGVTPTTECFKSEDIDVTDAGVKNKGVFMFEVKSSATAVTCK
eukprot:GHVT01087311.1.p1 GENE.GHVT01087311.1~~GHVT01087311.1.p1  ORF type:complete len:357 (-),score=21.80 GHVT01087311.1:354-1424(-)